MIFSMIFRFMLDNAEPFALNLDTKPWRVAVRAQVILGFVALGLGKGGLFISTFLIAMAWLEPGWSAYAILCSVATVVVLAFGYIITFGRIEVEIDPEDGPGNGPGDGPKNGPGNGLVRLTRRIPFRRRTTTEPLANYQGVALRTRTDRDDRATHTLMLVHPNAALNAPLWQRRRPEAPADERTAYAETLGAPLLEDM